MVGWAADIVFARHGSDIVVCLLLRIGTNGAHTTKGGSDARNALQSVTTTVGTAGTAAAI
jgi:hypothetical protein